MSIRSFSLISVGVMLAATGCIDLNGPGTVKGQYALARVNGFEVPAASDGCGIPVLGGSLRMLGNTAERSITYRIDGKDRSYITSGPFSVAGDRVDFEFHETGGNVWRVTGTWQNDRITIEYPAPCDGTISELFERE